MQKHRDRQTVEEHENGRAPARWKEECFPQGWAAGGNPSQLSHLGLAFLTEYVLKTANDFSHVPLQLPERQSSPSTLQG